MDLTPVTELIATIPESIWGAIVGAILTLIPVLMTNRHSRQQQAQQLEFESRERHASLRRDVYLPAADAFIGVISGVGRLLNLEVAEDDIADRAQAFGAALTRIQMIASPETIKCVAELQREFVRTIATLQQKRHPMKIRQLQINVAAGALKNYDDQLEAFEHTSARLTSGVQLSSDDVNRYTEALFQVGHAEELRDEARIDWLRLMLAQETARAEMAREFVRRMEELVKLQTPLLAAIRGELETDEALHLIAEEAEKTNAVGVRAVTDMIPAIEHTVEEMRRDLAHYEQRRLAEAERVE